MREFQLAEVQKFLGDEPRGEVTERLEDLTGATFIQAVKVDGVQYMAFSADKGRYTVVYCPGTEKLFKFTNLNYNLLAGAVKAGVGK